MGEAVVPGEGRGLAAFWVGAWSVALCLCVGCLLAFAVRLQRGLLLRRAEAGSRPAASHFLLLRQKKLTKEKATRVREALRAPLRYS